MSKFSEELKRLQDTLSDAARIGKQEIVRGYGGAKKQLTRFQYIQKRKELFAELGRTLFEAYKDGLPETSVKTFISETEFKEIIGEIESLDAEIEQKLTSE